MKDGFIHHAKSILRSFGHYAFVMLLTFPQIALAQDDESAEPESKAKWLLMYCLVALLVGLSTFSICRPSIRRKKDG